MEKEGKRLKDLLIVPLILMACYLLLAVIWHLFSLPSSQELISLLTSFFSKYGLAVVFISALIEGFLIIGQYFPGGFVIFLGVVSAGRDVVRVIEVVSAVSLAFFISYYLNYLIGKHGWYRLFIKFGLKNSLDKAKKKLKKHLQNAILFGYWIPDLATITATAAGVLKVPQKKFLFYSVIAILIWNTLWGLLVFLLGSFALKLTGVKYVLLALVLWISIILIKYWIFDKKRGE